MQKHVLMLSLGVLSLAQPAVADEMFDKMNTIVSAESAAPRAISSDATIYGFDSAGAMITVREGSNGWWCMPDAPNTPGADPMCGDANSMEWVMAWMNKTTPPPGKIGFAYMLAGGSDSNTDPFAAGPTADNNWVVTGPHVMVFNMGDTMSGYPDGAQPDPTKPYVMYPGTPYAHLMLPVQ